ncbi:MAG: NAAT family transporter [Proteobacteria bacterium]|nr:NAAT family transporter [Pseudomonadota bacterium]NBY20785.1 NAAT family transporter [bacterium]
MRAFLPIWISTLGVIFAIVDPFGYVPIFLTMTAKDSDEQKRKMLKKACGTAFLVLTSSAFLGNAVLRFFGISIPALQISGGLILLVIAFEMVKVIPTPEKITANEESEGRNKEDISIIPLAIPMLSGPASIASVVVLSAKEDSLFLYPAIILSILVTLGFTYLILRSASRIFERVGLTGLNVMTRVMGLLLSAMAVQFVIDGYLGIK